MYNGFLWVIITLPSVILEHILLSAFVPIIQSFFITFSTAGNLCVTCRYTSCFFLVHVKEKVQLLSASGLPNILSSSFTTFLQMTGFHFSVWILFYLVSMESLYYPLESWWAGSFIHIIANVKNASAITEVQ